MKEATKTAMVAECKQDGANLNNVRCETTELPGTKKGSVQQTVIYEFKTNKR
jgi:hypothetical protein